MNFKSLIIILFFVSKVIHGFAQSDRPNIIFIYTDDQADWTLSCTGNSDAHTPHLDLLAQEGVRFENAFVTTPVCTPSRVSLMTSQYASEYGIYDFIAQPGHRLYDKKLDIGLDTASITFAEVFQDNGYRTGLIGKWHLGDWTDTDDKKYHPTNQGFDYFMGLTGGGTKTINPPLEKNGEMSDYKGLTIDILTDNAIDFINESVEGEAPFLLNIHYRAPHGAFLPVSPSDWSPYENMDPKLPNPNYPDLNVEKAKRKMKEYLASVTGIDRSVGRILDHIGNLKIDENTIVIFTSDHGYNMGHNGIEHKGNGVWITNNHPPDTKNIEGHRRPNLYDNSLKVPVIIKWPGILESGKVYTETTSNLDWYPTLIEMAGLSLPNNKIVRGKSLVPLLKGQKVTWDNDFYTEYSMIQYSDAYMRSYRTPEWKLVRDFINEGRDELYHIALDPEENINLIYDSRPEVKAKIKELHNKIISKMEEIGDPLLKEVEKRNNQNK